jgi:hypothetical protein
MYQSIPTIDAYNVRFPVRNPLNFGKITHFQVILPNYQVRPFSRHTTLPTCLVHAPCRSHQVCLSFVTPPSPPVVRACNLRVTSIPGVSCNHGSSRLTNSKVSMYQSIPTIDAYNVRFPVRNLLNFGKITHFQVILPLKSALSLVTPPHLLRVRTLPNSSSRPLSLVTPPFPPVVRACNSII